MRASTVSLPTLLSTFFRSFVFRPKFRQHSAFIEEQLYSSSKYMSLLSNEPVEHVPNLPSWMLKGRTKLLNKSTPNCKVDSGAVVYYWMQRDVRTKDNWALLLAAHFASSQNVPLRVLYSLPPPPPTPENKSDIPDLKDLPMTERHGKFLLGGLECVYNELKEHHIPLDVVMPDSYETVGECVHSCLISSSPVLVVTDFSPLRHAREWTELQLAPRLEQANIPFYQVDAHNVVPVWIASPKREYAARTIRPKIQKHLPVYLEKFPKLKKVATLDSNKEDAELPSFQRLLYESYLKMNSSVGELDWATPGTEAGLKQAESFIEKGLKTYDEKRNDPNCSQICSNLSPWANHGHVSFQRLALGVKKLNKHATASASFLEESIVRRELSDNFVYYAPYDYDALTAAYDWAQETLQTHSTDKREYVYTLEEFAKGETHDDLWNAAQLQAVRNGKIHGFLRMYWAKKILEWTESPEIALKTAQYLNDWFNIDGRDPNGFVGVGWSIMGIHDQGWKEREVFGKIRFMNYAGCKRKFKVPDFVARYKGAAANAQKASKQALFDTKKRSVCVSKPEAKKQKKTKA